MILNIFNVPIFKNSLTLHLGSDFSYTKTIEVQLTSFFAGDLFVRMYLAPPGGNIWASVSREMTSIYVQTGKTDGVFIFKMCILKGKYK